MDIKKSLAERVRPLEASAIREMFKLMGQADIISFAGGIPSPEVYPLDALADIAEEILKTNGTFALKYGITEGYAPLIAQVEEKNKRNGIGAECDATIITTGAQQGIDLAAKCLLDPGDGVIVESPTFVGTLNSLRSYQAKLYGVNVESDGIDLCATEEILKSKKIKMIYTIPTFQNPTGITMSIEKRKDLLELAKKYDCLILEDNPYGELRFKGDDVPTIKSMDDEGRVIYVGSFSKTLSPGMRVGFLVGHSALMERIIVVKQANDVHTPLITQMIISEFMKRYDMDAHIAKGAQSCKKKCEAMLSAMDGYFPDKAVYTRPDGGIFLWVTLPEGTDTVALSPKAIANKVAFVPGNSFMVSAAEPSNCFRLNFTTASDEQIEQGIKALGELLKKELQ